MKRKTFFKTVLYCSPMVLIILSAQVRAQSSSSRRGGLYGDWQIKYEVGGRQRESVLSISRDREGNRTGQWISFWGLSELKDLKYENGQLSFARVSRNRDGQSTMSKFTGTIQDGKLSGTMSSDRGEYKLEGKPSPPMPRAVGSWEMKFKRDEREITSTLVIKVDKEGKLTAQWPGPRESEITDLQYERGKLTFKRNILDRQREWTFEGTIQGDTLSYVMKSERAEFTSEGKLIGGSLIGTWNLEAISERGTRKQRLLVNPDMSGLYGAIPVKKINLEGDQVSFRIILEFGDQKFEMSFEGKVEDSKLTGELASSRGSQKIKGTKVIYAFAGQRPDPNFNPSIENPAYPRGMGPLVLIDEAHNNFHTMAGRYKSFADLLARDGYVVRPNKSSFERDSLKSADILVVSNALSDQNMKDWSLPTYSAFKDDEIAHVRDWVREGGALLLIADHMPWPGCAEKLATAFGVDWKNGYARPKERGRLIFRRSDGSLVDHSITKGRSESERVDSVATFGGSAFQVGKDAEPLFIFGEGAVCYMVEAPGKVTEQTPIVPIDGWLQGAVMRFGKGRAAFFGEAAMFSAQLTGLPGRPMGMNNPIASENPQFILNLMHWLSGLQGVSREVSLTLSQ